MEAKGIKYMLAILLKKQFFYTNQVFEGPFFILDMK